MPIDATLSDARPRLGAAARAGFTLIEALAALLISSLILTVLMGMAASAIDRNARLGAGALEQMTAQFEEEIFRTLLQEFVLPLQEFGERPPENYLRGDADSFAGYVSVRRPTACAAPAPASPVELRIERLGAGGRLVCVTEGARVALVAWEAGVAQFAYSRDGREWRADWPAAAAASMTELLPQRGQTPVRLETTVIPTVIAPLVRFSLDAPGENFDRIWIARAGSTMARPNSRTDFFGATPSPFDDLEFDESGKEVFDPYKSK